MTLPEAGFLQRRLGDAVALEPADRELLAALEGDPVLARQGEVLIPQGSSYTHVGVLQAGWAISTKDLPGGRRQVLDFLLPGSVLGWQAAMFRTADWGVIARTDILVSWVPVGRLTRILRQSPGISHVFNWLASCDHAILTERLASIGQRPARERLAHLLLELWRRMWRLGLSAEAAAGFPLSQAVLADAVGLSPVHVNRSLRGLAKDGLIRVRRQAITVLDAPGLAAITAYDDGYLHEGRTGVDGTNRFDAGPAPS